MDTKTTGSVPERATPVDTTLRGPADGYDHQGVQIIAQKLQLAFSVANSNQKLVTEFVFINNTKELLIVDRDQMTLRLGDGSTRRRYAGARPFGGGSSSAHTIAPGSRHPVHMDFLVGDRPGGETIALVMSGVTLDGKPMELPDYVITVPP
jgi:hypothetical protein